MPAAVERLSAGEVVAATIVLALWLLVFTAGAVVDSRPLRDSIQVFFGADAVRLSAEGEARRLEALHEEAKSNEDLRELLASTLVTDAESAAVLPAVAAPPPRFAAAPMRSASSLAGPYQVAALTPLELVWTTLSASICYIVSNIAILAMLASILGALGNQARLGHTDHVILGRDDVNPIVSAAIRGFTVYVVIISGVLAIVEAPFKTPSVEQYFRLAGFTSLFAFLVSYDPSFYQEIVSQVRKRTRGRVTGGADDDAAPGAPDPRYPPRAQLSAPVAVPVVESLDEASPGPAPQPASVDDGGEEPGR